MSGYLRDVLPLARVHGLAGWRQVTKEVDISELVTLANRSGMVLSLSESGADVHVHYFKSVPLDWDVIEAIKAAKSDLLKVLPPHDPAFKYSPI